MKNSEDEYHLRYERIIKCPYLLSLKTPSDILNATLAREKDAHAFYSETLRHVSNESLRNLLEKLKDAEYKHVHIVEQMIAKMQLG